MESWLQSEVITLKETRISNDIIIFAGTTEGRTLSEYLAAAGIAHTICVATEYGELVLKEHPLVTVHRGRMDEEAMREYLKQKAFAAVPRIPMQQPLRQISGQQSKTLPSHICD